MQFFTQGFLLGLSMGIFCFSFCGIMLIPIFLAGDKKRILKTLGQFLGGRLIGVLLLGGLVGYLGNIADIPQVKTISSLALIILSLLLIFYCIKPKKKDNCPSPVKGKMPLVFGFLTGINLCPPFLLGLTYVFNVGGALKGMLFFFGFFLSTSLYLFPFSFLGLLKKEFFYRLGQIIGIIVGTFFLIQGIRSISIFSPCFNCPFFEGNLETATPDLWAIVLLIAILSLGIFSIKTRKYFEFRYISLAISFIVFGLLLRNLFCPLLTFQILLFNPIQLLSGKAIFLFFIIPVLVSLIFGKIFCGWACPMGAWQEFISKLGDFLHFPKLKIRFPYLKYIILSFLIIAILFVKQPILCGLDPFGFLFRHITATSALASFIIFTLASAFIFRPWCRFFCPYGAILSLLAKISFFKLKINKEKCLHCSICEKNCPNQAINIKKGKIDFGQCELCGKCLKNCPQKTIKLN